MATESKDICLEPGTKIKSKGKGRGLERGKGRGPIGMLRSKLSMLAAQEPNLGNPDPTGGTQMSTTAAQMSNAQNLAPKLNVLIPAKQSTGGPLGKKAMSAAPARNVSSIPFRDGATSPVENQMNIVDGTYNSQDPIMDESVTYEQSYPMVGALPGEARSDSVVKVSGISPKMVRRLFNIGNTASQSYEGANPARADQKAKRGMLSSKVAEEESGDGGAYVEMKGRHMEEAHEQKMRHNEDMHEFKVQQAQQKLAPEDGAEMQAAPPAPMEPDQEQLVLQNAMQNLQDKQVQVGPLKEGSVSPLENLLRFY